MEENNVPTPELGQEVTPTVPSLTKKQKKEQELAQKKESQFWNTAPSRAEIFQRIQQAVQESEARMLEHVRGVYILARSTFQVLCDKGSMTQEELQTATATLHESIYGKQPEPEMPTEETLNNVKEEV